MPEGSINTLPAPAETSSAARPRRRRARGAVLAAVGVLAVGIGAGVLWLTGGRYVTTDDAYVQTDQLLIATDVSGVVERVAVTEGERVAEGQVLFVLDAAPFRNAADQARADLAETALSLHAMQAEYRRTERDIAAQEAAVQLATLQFDRQSQLLGTQAVSRAAYDQARFGLQQAKEQLAGLRSEAQMQLARLGPAGAEGAVETHPQYLAAAAKLAEAKRQLDHATVKAPFAGIVTRVAQLQPGQYLAAATPAFGLVAADHAWVEAQPKETELAFVQPGARASVTIDAYPGRVWQGEVASVSPASDATFSVLPAQNSSGNWVKVVQRIPLRIRIEEPEGGPLLRAGMSAEVRIDTGHERRVSDLWR